MDTATRLERASDEWRAAAEALEVERQVSCNLSDGTKCHSCQQALRQAERREAIAFNRYMEA